METDCSTMADHQKLQQPDLLAVGLYVATFRELSSVLPFLELCFAFSRAFLLCLLCLGNKIKCLIYWPPFLPLYKM